ncbi:MAG: transglycosylase SLT domain-containing protein [Noviherbaspirillum sp.]
MKWTAGLVLACASIVLPAAHAQQRQQQQQQFGSDDEMFAALRDAARRDDSAKAFELSSRLANYSIPSYIEYYRLKPRVKDLPDAEIRDFLSRHDGTAIADRLRNDWLLELGKARDWKNFDEQYPLFALDDDTQVKCYALMSRIERGHNVAADARALLVTPKDYGEACPALVMRLAETRQFTDDDVWHQVRLAAEYNYPNLMRRLALATDAPEGMIQQAYDKPGAVLARSASGPRAVHEAFLIALGRVARGNLEQAGAELLGASSYLSPGELATGWSIVAMQAAQKLQPDAVTYWKKTAAARLSLDGYQWRVRSALRAGDWALVRSGIEAMPASLKDDSAWIYWLGRAYKAQGQREQADECFQSIAGLHSFYGQLALEELGQKITIPAQAAASSEDEVAAMAANPGFRRAFRFFDMNMRFEGYREWNWQLRRMTERQLLAAAEFARRSNVLDRMVNTSDRTKRELDFTQRFPSPHNDIMHPATRDLGLDKAWVYGLIRQESRFLQVARSHVGASGLMQLMPATAKEVARKIGMSDFSQARINEVGTNIMLGTNYLYMVLQSLDGSQPLATAAYNAGPGRPKAWRATLTRPVEGAIFAETIPFAETRGYVKNVMSNATYYAALFDNTPQSLKARMGTITPKGYNGSPNGEPF